MPPYLIFDLDGTLFDTSIDLANSVNYALEEFDLPAHDIATIISFIGNGSMNLIRRSVGEQCENAVRDVHHCFLAHYQEHCTIATKPYPGILELLQKPIRASILTNKPDAPTRKILAHFGLKDRFEHVLCGDTAPARKPSPDGLLHILKLALVAPSDALMVGDDLPDMGCARAAQVPSVAMLGGFGKSEDLLAQNPTYTAKDFHDFARLITS